MIRTVNPWIMLVLALATMSCAATTPAAKTSGGQTPLTADEIGLRTYMEQVEQVLRHSAQIENDPILNAYVRRVFDELTPGVNRELKIYIVRTPAFNVSLAPTGYIQIWTGLFLRIHNEAQLAYVLAHAIAHNEEKHDLLQWRELHAPTGGKLLHQLLTDMLYDHYAAIPWMDNRHDMSELAPAAGIIPFTHEQEVQADRRAIAIMTEAGYDPREALFFLEALSAEQKAQADSEKNNRWLLHPINEERLSRLESEIEKIPDADIGVSRRGGDYQSQIRAFRGGWLKDELKKNEYNASVIVLQNLFDTGSNLGELFFYQGELYRKRGQGKDLYSALDCYTRSIAQGNAPPDAYRASGLLHWKLGQKDQARDYLNTYLKQSPIATDHQMIRFYLQELE